MTDKTSIQNQLSQAGEFVKHTLYDPLSYDRNFTHDLPKKGAHLAKRVALIALPFIALYKPAGTALSLTMGGARTITTLSASIKSATKNEKLKALHYLILTTLAVIAVAATLFHFQLGLLITSFADAATSLYESCIHLKNKEYIKAIESLLQAAGSMLYLSFMISGSLELMLASILLQAATSLLQARLELKEGRIPEALAKIAFGAIRFHQAKGCFDMIQKRNAFLKLERFASLLDKIQKGKGGSHLIDSSLNEEKKPVILIDANGNEYNFGSHFHGTGKGVVKGMNLQFRGTVIDGKSLKEVDFKVNHVFRDRLETQVIGMNNLGSEEAKEFLSLTGSHAKGIRIEKVPFEFCHETNKTIGEAYKVSLDGLGEVFIGASKNMPGIYDTVRVRLEENKSIFDLHEILTFFNLDDALRKSSSQDIERLKIGQLYRTLLPKEATSFERNSDFFDLPVDQLKEEIIKKSPQMKDIFDSYLNEMNTVEILPGRLRYSLPQISKLAKHLGARALVSTITGTSGSMSTTSDRVISILQMGMMAGELRYRNGMTQAGLSPSSDFYTGGSDSVYTQLLTKKNFDEHMNLYNLYWGDARILFSLDALNSLTYQYHYDSYGTRRTDSGYFGNLSTYFLRPNIIDFVKTEAKQFNYGNEVMIKERIPPSMITGILVSTEALKNDLLGKLRNSSLIDNQSGIESIFNIPLDQFIRVGTTL